MEKIKFFTPFTDKTIESLRYGDEILLSGDIFTGRDAAHKRMIGMLDNNLPLPFNISGQAIYYAGPCPAPPGRVIGSIGPTTSKRMDIYSPRLIKEGLRVMIGKGARGSQVSHAICKYKGLYLTAVGGAAALLSLCVKDAQLVAFEDLGTEAVYKLSIHEMPLVVAIDCKGGNIYEYRK